MKSKYRCASRSSAETSAFDPCKLAGKLEQHGHNVKEKKEIGFRKIGFCGSNMGK